MRMTLTLLVNLRAGSLGDTLMVGRPSPRVLCWMQSVGNGGWTTMKMPSNWPSLYLSPASFYPRLLMLSSPKYWHLVETGTYVDHPWGKVAFKELMRCYTNPLNVTYKFNRLTGFSYALQL